MKRLNKISYVINVLVALTYIICSYLDTLHFEVYGVEVLYFLFAVFTISCGMYLISLYSDKRQNAAERQNAVEKE